MKKFQLPSCLVRLGVRSPDLIVLDGQETLPSEGLPYVRVPSSVYNDRNLASLVVMKMLYPKLVKKYPYIKWQMIVSNLGFGEDTFASVAFENVDEFVGTLLRDDRFVDMDVLAQLDLMPHFMLNIREAIKLNLSSSMQWEYGYNKRLGCCAGNIRPQRMPHNLVIMDMSSSMPTGLVAAMLSMMATMVDICHADLIVTSAYSFFWKNEEVSGLDPTYVLKKVGRCNESKMFCKILENIDLVYDNVIAFGDTDNPSRTVHDVIERKMTAPKIGKLYSMFIDNYNICWNSKEKIAGYAQWALPYVNPKNVEVNLDWHTVFNKDM